LAESCPSSYKNVLGGERVVPAFNGDSCSVLERTKPFNLLYVVLLKQEADSSSESTHYLSASVDRFSKVRDDFTNGNAELVGTLD
jgi:hypothetical protein